MNTGVKCCPGLRLAPGQHTSRQARLNSTSKALTTKLLFEPQPTRTDRTCILNFKSLPACSNRQLKQKPESHNLKCPRYNAKLLIISRTRKVSTEIRKNHRRMPSAMMTHILECDEDLKAAIIKCSSKLLQTLLEKKKGKIEV